MCWFPLRSRFWEGRARKQMGGKGQRWGEREERDKTRRAGGRQGRKSREEREKRGPVKTRSRGENGSYTDRKPRPLPAPHGASLEH